MPENLDNRGEPSAIPGSSAAEGVPSSSAAEAAGSVEVPDTVPAEESASANTPRDSIPSIEVDEVVCRPSAD
jgi:hypothetical protein